jgi:pyridoxal phosphate enzyme (YggS family)
MTDLIKSNLANVKQIIEESARSAGRHPADIKLLAVSKNFLAQIVLDLAQYGQQEFAENYVQEGVEKVQYIKKNHPEFDLIWHFIGPLQSNKTRLVAEHFDWVQSIDRIKIAQRLSEQRPAHLAPLQVCLQVNIDAGPTKSGVNPALALELADEVRKLPNLELRGIMTIPDPQTDWDKQVLIHSRAKVIFDQMRNTIASVRFDTLSMGMSSDINAAIYAGSTMVRVGTALFGERRKT